MADPRAPIVVDVAEVRAGDRLLIHASHWLVASTAQVDTEWRIRLLSRNLPKGHEAEMEYWCPPGARFVVDRPSHGLTACASAPEPTVYTAPVDAPVPLSLW